MSRAVAKRQVQVSNPMPSSGLIIGLIIVGLIIWFLMKRKEAQPTGQYLNEEKWDISYNADGLPTSVTIHRDARRS